MLVGSNYTLGNLSSQRSSSIFSDTLANPVYTSVLKNFVTSANPPPLYTRLTASHDGKHQYAVDSGTGFYFSVDRGATWSTGTSPLSAPTYIECNPDGSMVVLGNATATYISRDFGLTFGILGSGIYTILKITERSEIQCYDAVNRILYTNLIANTSLSVGAGLGTVNDFCISDNAEFIYFGTSTGLWRRIAPLYSEVQLNSTITVFSMDCSNDGRYVYMVVPTAGFWASSDFGVTFATPVSNVSYGNGFVACSRDGYSAVSTRNVINSIYSTVNFGATLTTQNTGSSATVLSLFCAPDAACCYIVTNLPALYVSETSYDLDLGTSLSAPKITSKEIVATGRSSLPTLFVRNNLEAGNSTVLGKLRIKRNNQPANGECILLGNTAGVQTSTPLSINMGGTFSDSAGTNAKLRIFDDGSGSVYGLGVSANQLDYIAPSVGATGHHFYLAGVKYMQIGANITAGTNVLVATNSFVGSVSGNLNLNPAAGGNVSSTSNVILAATRFVGTATGDLALNPGAGGNVTTASNIVVLSTRAITTTTGNMALNPGTGGNITTASNIVVASTRIIASAAGNLNLNPAAGGNVVTTSNLVVAATRSISTVSGDLTINPVGTGIAMSGKNVTGAAYYGAGAASSTAGNPKFRVADAGAGISSGIGFTAAATNLVTYEIAQNVGAHVFYSNNIERMRISSAGVVAVPAVTASGGIFSSNVISSSRVLTIGSQDANQEVLIAVPGGGTNPNIRIQCLGGGNTGFSFIGFSGGFNNAEINDVVGKTRYRMYCNQIGASDVFGIDYRTPGGVSVGNYLLFNGGATPTMTAGTNLSMGNNSLTGISTLDASIINLGISRSTDYSSTVVNVRWYNWETVIPWVSPSNLDNTALRTDTTARITRIGNMATVLVAGGPAFSTGVPVTYSVLAARTSNPSAISYTTVSTELGFTPAPTTQQTTVANKFAGGSIISTQLIITTTGIMYFTQGRTSSSDPVSPSIVFSYLVD